jgi:Fe-S-cluster containining protein
MARPSEEFDCTRCGACCTNPDENRAEGFVDYVEVVPRDAIWAEPRLAQRFVVYNAEGQPHLRLHQDGRCLALRGRLGRSVRCTIYEHRPAACRKVEPGSERCLAHRRERSL